MRNHSPRPRRRRPRNRSISFLAFSQILRARETTRRPITTTRTIRWPFYFLRANLHCSCLYERPMNIQVAVLCDAATDDNGKLNLLGAFDTIKTPQLPAVHPQCSIALRVTFFSGDEGKHELQLNFVDAY